MSNTSALIAAIALVLVAVSPALAGPAGEPAAGPFAAEAEPNMTPAYSGDEPAEFIGFMELDSFRVCPPGSAGCVIDDHCPPGCVCVAFCCEGLD